MSKNSHITGLKSAPGFKRKRNEVKPDKEGVFFLCQQVFNYWIKGWKLAQAVQRGSKTSRFIRHLFEVSFIRTIIGTVMVAVFVLTTAFRGSVGGSFGLTQGWDNKDTYIISVTEASQIVTQKGTQLPLPYMKLNQPYRFYHKGVDLDGDLGDLVRPVTEGKVDQVIYSRYAYGNHVIVNHGSGFRSLYAHLSKVDVKSGQEVSKSSKLGEVGSTGWSTGPHLHLEFHINGESVDPMQYLKN
jgi:hypothetical protein